MIFTGILSTLVFAFNVSSSNLTNYEFHATGQSDIITLSTTSTTFVYDTNIYSTCNVTFDADLWFNTPSNDEYDWVFCIRNLNISGRYYIYDSNLNEYTFAGDYEFTQPLANYSISNPGTNQIWYDSDGDGNNGLMNVDFYYDETEQWLSFEFYQNSPRVSYIDFNIIPSLPDDYTSLKTLGFQYSFNLSSIRQGVSYFIDSYFATGGSFEQGYSNGYDYGYDQGYNEGYGNGFNDGFNTALETNSTALTIFNGILNIALVPVNFFLGIFNFEILGINLSSFFSALLSICCIIIVLRIVFQGGSKGGDK